MLIDTREDARWTVYIHIVPKAISGYNYDKYYVGITGISPQKRWGKNGSLYKRKNCKGFNHAIEKYGWDNIQHTVVCTHLTEREAKEMEKTLIRQLDSFGKHGYNLTDGGDGTCGVAPKNCSKTYVFDRNNTLLGVYASRNDCALKTGIKLHLIVTAIHNHTSVNNMFFCEAQDVNDKGDKIENFESYHDVYTTFKFDLYGRYISKYMSVAEAARMNNCSEDGIRDVIKRLGMGTEYVWRSNLDVIWNGETYEIKDNKYREKFVYYFDANGNFIEMFNSPLVAAKALNISDKYVYCILERHGVFIRSNTYKCLLAHEKDVTWSAYGKPSISFVNPKKKTEEAIAKQFKKVYQFNNRGDNLICIYPSVKEASVITGINKTTISRYASNRIVPVKTQYCWRYERDVKKLPNGSFLMLR